MLDDVRLILELDPAFFLDALAQEAEARGDSFRFRSLARAREEDGLDPSDAELEAAQSLGLDLALEGAIEEALEPLLNLPESTDAPVPAWWEGGSCEVVVRDTRGNLPTLRRTPLGFALWLPAVEAAGLGQLTSQLVQVFVDDPERTVATVETGLGGSGGCACGEDLPEDAPVGPLFAHPDRGSWPARA